MAFEPGVSIIIPTWNGKGLLEQFLPSVITAATHHYRVTERPVEILIVDDGSMDDTIPWLTASGFTPYRKDQDVEEIQPAGLALRYLRNEKNLGFGSTCNSGFACARARLVFLLNNDVEVHPKAIAPLVDGFSDSNVFAVHCRVFDYETNEVCGTGKVGGFSRGFIRVHQSYVKLDAAESSGAASCGRLFSIFASGGSAMFDRDKFLELGGFESLFAPAYWEDVELSYRAWKRGYRVIFEPRSVVRHRISSTMRRLRQSKIRRVQQRNRLLFHWINLHDKRFLAAHIARVILLFISSPLTLKPGFMISVMAALKRLPAILKRREIERQAARRTDREVLEIFNALRVRPDLLVYDDTRELERHFKNNNQEERAN